MRQTLCKSFNALEVIGMDLIQAISILEIHLCDKSAHINQAWDMENERNLEPYVEGECTHERRFEYKGRLRCQQCSAVYDENLQAWTIE